MKNVKFKRVGKEIYLSERKLGGEAIPQSMKIKIFAGILVFILFGELVNAQILSAPTINEYIINNSQQEDEEYYLDLWIEKLINHECLNCGPKYRRVDSNGQYSYGCLQFQEATFRNYSKRYNLLEKEEFNHRDSIYSCENQKLIVKKMYEEMGNSYQFGRNWYTTIYKKGLGLPVKEDETKYLSNK